MLFACALRVLYACALRVLFACSTPVLGAVDFEAEEGAQGGGDTTPLLHLLHLPAA